MNNKMLLFGGAGVLGIGAAVALFMGSGPDDAPPPPVTTTTTTSSSSDAVVTHTGGSELSEQPVDAGERKTADKKTKKTKPGQDAEALNKQLNEGFGLHARTAGPTWNALAYKLALEGEEDLSAECKTLGQELAKEMRNTEADAGAWIERERAMLDRLNASPAANIVADEIRKLDELITELEGA